MVAQLYTPRLGPGQVERVTDFFETDLLDKRSYRVIKLPNGLEVFLAHDAETDKASASMDVRVGSFSNDEDMPGIAHAVEHLLFMGTKKYPEENAYSRYLAANSGDSNAYTSRESTHYYFRVNAKKSDTAGEDESSPFYGAMDRFAQFFIEPLFLSNTVDRELQAVDSEHKKNLQSDNWREQQLESFLSNPEHPFCRFATGNLEVLKIGPEARGIDIKQRCVEFYEKHYSANRMKLAILGREPLDVLERWASELFSKIPNKNLKKNRWEEPLFREEDLLIQCFIKPISEKHQMVMSFPTIDTEDMFDSRPDSYLSNLLGHEGPGSLFSYFKDKGWINSIATGSLTVCSGTPDVFICRMNLTEDGLEKYRDIMKAFFQYVSLLRETPPQQWIFEEQKQIGELRFKFKGKDSPVAFTSFISSAMQTQIPRERLDSSRYIARDFNPELIRTYLEFLRPDNFRIMLISQKFSDKCDKKEKWYGTEYACEKIPAILLSELEQARENTNKDRPTELHLPRKNQLIPTNLNVEKKVVKHVSLSPTLIRNDDFVRLWHKKDDQFWVPKGAVIIKFRSSIINVTPENLMKSRIYSVLVEDTLEEYLYDASLVGFGIKIGTVSNGIEVIISGFNDKLSVLLEKVLLTMKNLEVNQDRIKVIKERIMQSLKNEAFLQPYRQIGDYVTLLNRGRNHLNEQLISVLPYIRNTDIQQFFPQILTQMHLDILVHGNFFKEDALIISDMVERILKPRPFPKSCWEITRSTLFPEGGNYLYRRTLKDPKNVNNCIAYQLFIGNVTNHSLCVKTRLMKQLTKEPAFHQLRTVEQLGYVVFTDCQIGVNTINFQFLVQSEKSAEYLETRVEAFLVTFAKTLESMTDNVFEDHKMSLITERLKKLENLSQELYRIYSHIYNDRLDFELAEKDAAEAKLITKSSMIEFYQQYFDPESPKRSKLVIHLQAQSSSSSPTTISDQVTNNGPVPYVQSDPTETNNDIMKTSPRANSKVPYIVTDLHDFKSRLSCSSGPVPVKPLSEYTESGSKL